MVDVGHAVLRPDGVDAALEDFERRRPFLPPDPLARVDPVDVDRLALEAAGDFFATNQREHPRDRILRVQPGHLGQDVVVAEHEKVVAVVLVPPRDLVGRAVAVAFERVSVSIPLEPVQCRRLRRFHPGKRDESDRQCPGGEQQQAAQHQQILAACC